MRHGLLILAIAIVVVAPWLYIFRGWWISGRRPSASWPAFVRFSFNASRKMAITPWPLVDQLLPAAVLSLAFIPLAVTAHRGFARGELGLDQYLTRRAPDSLTLLSQAVNAPVWTGLVLVLAVILFVTGRRRESIILVLADVSGDFVGVVLKLIVNRQEVSTENIVGHFMLLQNELFPSGHVIRASITVGLLVAFLFWNQPRLRWPAVGVAVVFLAILGVTQAAVGGHLPLDVLGGYVFAGIWINLALVVSRLRLPSRSLKALPART